jgi:hypothetical protein
MAFRFAGDRFSSLFDEDDNSPKVSLGNLSINNIEQRNFEQEDEETLRELERNEQSIRSAISRLKARRVRRRPF